MTGSTAMPVPEDEPQTGARSAFAQFIWLLLISVAIIFGVGVIFGALAAHSKDGGAMSPFLIAILAGVVLAIAALALVGWRKILARSRTVGQLTSRERRNRNVLIGCGIAGGVMGVALVLANGIESTPDLLALSSGPLPPAVAILLALVFLVPLPIISYYWHNRVIDEQEAAAYREGALLGLYTYWIGAPVWWFLWRGGLVPAPDGVAIYLIVTLVAGIVWMRAKYR